MHNQKSQFRGILLMTEGPEEPRKQACYLESITKKLACMEEEGTSRRSLDALYSFLEADLSQRAAEAALIE